MILFLKFTNINNSATLYGYFRCLSFMIYPLPLKVFHCNQLALLWSCFPLVAYMPVRAISLIVLIPHPMWLPSQLSNSWCVGLFGGPAVVLASCGCFAGSAVHNLGYAKTFVSISYRKYAADQTHSISVESTRVSLPRRCWHLCKIFWASSRLLELD